MPVQSKSQSLFYFTFPALFFRFYSQLSTKCDDFEWWVPTTTANKYENVCLLFRVWLCVAGLFDFIRLCKLLCVSTDDRAHGARAIRLVCWLWLLAHRHTHRRQTEPARQRERAREKHTNSINAFYSIPLRLPQFTQIKTNFWIVNGHCVLLSLSHYPHVVPLKLSSMPLAHFSLAFSAIRYIFLLNIFFSRYFLIFDPFDPYLIEEEKKSKFRPPFHWIALAVLIFGPFSTLRLCWTTLFFFLFPTCQIGRAMAWVWVFFWGNWDPIWVDSNYFKGNWDPIKVLER